MPRNEKTKTIKFNMDKQEDRELWEWLQTQPHGDFSVVTKQFWRLSMQKGSNIMRVMHDEFWEKVRTESGAWQVIPGGKDRKSHEDNHGISNESEIVILLDEIERLKKKYGKDTDHAVDMDNLTSEQESDMSRLRFFRNRLEELMKEHLNDT